MMTGLPLCFFAIHTVGTKLLFLKVHRPRRP